MTMIDELRKQAKKTVMEYLKNRLADPTIYSLYQKGLGLMMPDWETYLLANPKEVVIVAIDSYSSSLPELADEEPFNGEFPLYFTESSHRKSPAFQLAITCNMMENHLERLSIKHAPRVWGVLLTGSEIINYDDMTEEWENLHISVFDGITNLRNLDLVVNSPEHLPLHTPPVAFACSVGFSEDNVKDALRKLGNRMGTDYSFVQEEGSMPIQIFNFDDDYDLNDDVDEDEPFPEESEMHAKSWKELFEGNQLMQHVASISFNLPTSCFTPLYTFGSTSVILSPEKGFCLDKNRFKCFIFTKDFYPMCNNVEDGHVHISENDSLTIEGGEAGQTPISLWLWVPGWTIQRAAACLR